MNCPKCGFANGDGAQTCAACRNPLAIANGAVPIPQPQFLPPPAPVAVSQEMKWGIFAGTLFLPPLGFIMGIIYLAANEPHKKSVGLLWLLTSIFAPFLFWRMLFL